MTLREPEHLRVLIANERKDRLALVAPIVIALVHEVIARSIQSGSRSRSTSLIATGGMPWNREKGLATVSPPNECDELVRVGALRRT